MQQKRGHVRVKIFAGLAAFAIASIAIVLATRDIPAPQQPVVKTLDAKSFLDTKQ